MSDLLLPTLSAPSNLSIPEEVHAEVIDSDVYNICNRIKEEVEGGERLKIILMVHGDKHSWTIMETGDDGVEYIVFKVGPGYAIDALDDRVIKRLRYILHKPLPQRVRELELEEEAYKAEHMEQELEELYDKMGGEFWRDLEKCGFIQRGVSYPILPKNRAQRRAKA